MSDDASARLALPYLAAGQMQKHVTLNEALTRLDALVQSAVVSRSTIVQPADPADGALYLLTAGAEGEDWGGRAAGTLMRFEAGGWTVVPVTDGAIVVVLDESLPLVRIGLDWHTLGKVLGQVQNLTRLGLGAEADTATPFIARLNAALWTAREAEAGGSGDLRLTLNKQAPGDLASLLFQSGYGGRAELGLVGNDDLTLKVSAEGSAWHEVFTADRTTGRMTPTLGTLRSETVVVNSSGGWTPPPWARWVEVTSIGGGGGGAGGGFGASGTLRLGGGGGSAGGVSHAGWAITDLTAALTITIGASGAGGASGTAGGDGGTTVVAMGGQTLVTAPGGRGGAASTGAGGAGVTGVRVSNAGGTALAAGPGQAGRSQDDPFGSGGGGAGGSLTAANASGAGGSGGDGAALTVRALGGVGATGGGAAGVACPVPALGWQGGGGGGGGASSAGAGFSGGTGGGSGAGGGGGGAGLTGGGAGGAGAPGRVWLRTIG